MNNDVGLVKESARNQAKESGRPSEGLSVYADSSDTEEVSGRGWLLYLSTGSHQLWEY